jgi:hypothetical protein
MAVDRTMERWRMQLARSAAPTANAASTPVQVAPQQTNTNDLEKLLEAMQTLNQQNLQALAAMQQQSMQVTIEQVTRVTVEAMRDTLTALPVYHPPAQLEAPKSEQSEKQEGLTSESITVSGEKSESYADRIEALYKRNPAITVTDIVEQTGCSTSTAHKWLKRVQPPVQSEKGRDR